MRSRMPLSPPDVGGTDKAAVQFTLESCLIWSPEIGPSDLDSPEGAPATPNRLGWVTVQLRDYGMSIDKQRDIRDAQLRAANEDPALNEIEVVQVPCPVWK